jgi:hypothetical protein
MADICTEEVHLNSKNSHFCAVMFGNTHAGYAHPVIQSFDLLSLVHKKTRFLAQQNDVYMASQYSLRVLNSFQQRAWAATLHLTLIRDKEALCSLLTGFQFSKLSPLRNSGGHEPSVELNVHAIRSCCSTEP